ncbi:MAG: hypothetical protein ACYTBV_15780, partial [Planctomycetota bacterium]
MRRSSYGEFLSDRRSRLHWFQHLQKTRFGGLTGKKSNLAGIIDRLEFIEADMGDEDTARSAMKNIDVVFHQGALPSVP